jgi:hypothetical protein
MKNLNTLNTIPIDEFDLIKARKNITTRNRLNQVRPNIVLNYNNYIDNFFTIQNIGNSTYIGDEENDLRGCYTIKTKARDNLLSRIIDKQTTHFKHICPHCLLLPRTTFDHYIPEANYPEYSVLSKNLIPCCTTCNGKKLEFWRVNGNRAIIHYYYDLIPDIQFLFGNLEFDFNNIPIITFSINHTVGIDANLFNIIQTHFTRLELTERYSKSIDLLISDIKDDVDSNRAEFGDILTQNSISNIIINKSNRNKIHYGINYWKSIAMDLLANSDKFINSI